MGQQHLTYNWAVAAESTHLVMTDDVAESRFLRSLIISWKARKRKPAELYKEASAFE